MKSMDATTCRKLNLRYLCDINSRKAVAERTGKTVAQINQLLGNIKGNNGRFGPNIARDIESSLSIQYGWLDTPHPEHWDDESGAFANSQPKDDSATSIPMILDEESELLSVFRNLPKSGRLAVLASAYHELEKCRPTGNGCVSL
jgi:hypothetical protein